MIESRSGSNSDQSNDSRFRFKRMNIAKNPTVSDTTTTIETTFVGNTVFLAAKNLSQAEFRMVHNNPEEDGVGVAEGGGDGR